MPLGLPSVVGSVEEWHFKKTCKSRLKLTCIIHVFVFAPWDNWNKLIVFKSRENILLTFWHNAQCAIGVLLIKNMFCWLWYNVFLHVSCIFKINKWNTETTSVHRSSSKKGYLEISQIVQENTCGWGLTACTFIKKRLQRRCYLVKFAKFLKTPFLQNNTSSGCFCLYKKL